MVDADVRLGGEYDEGTAIRKRPRRRSSFSVLRILLLGCFIVSVVAGLALWPTVEARPFEVVLNDAKAMTKWFEERFTEREGISSFRYEGSTDTLTAQVTEALSAALHSDPFIRYNVSKYSFQWKGSVDYALVTVYVEYRETREQTQFVLNRAHEIVQEITAPDDSPHQKVKAIHDYVVSHLTYDEGMTKFTAYEALTEGKTVCQGYALLVHAMLIEAGIPGQIIEGEAGGTLHAWNLVQLDGSWYHLDATWDDPLPNRDGQIRYTYYLRTDEEMRGDHIWTAEQAPAAETAGAAVRAAAATAPEAAQAPPQQSAAQTTAAPAESLKSALLQLLQSEALPPAVREAAQQLVHQITGQQLLLTSDRQAPFTHVTLFVPLVTPDGQQTAAVHIQSRQSRRGELESDNCRLWFDLNMKALGRTLVDVQVVERAVALHIHQADEGIGEWMGEFRGEVEEAMNRIGYQLSAFRILPMPDTKVDEPKNRPEIDMDDYALQPYKGVDIKV
ncbi:transglutaminase domain-containing protein [Paenibacillus thiaminolyticus]|uniref:transglutaminase domain-containing protein n=1 Tax=Paenibacillus thiaminolyticus TaxID=49283 RepID=UPI002280ED8E|nr:transglutaminase domain-containing protein [Paenibacillus thiaminolyticus]MCY9653492.1 hypothetical protein [Paenibacillus thiaminolyticus]